MSRANDGKGNREVERERGRNKERERELIPSQLAQFSQISFFIFFFFAADEKCIKLISLDRVRVRGEESGRETARGCVRACACACGIFISHFALGILQNLNRSQIHFGNENHALCLLNPNKRMSISQRRPCMSVQGGCMRCAGGGESVEWE